MIVDTLAEKTYQHGHAIGRREAEEIGLEVVKPPDDVENMMWELYEAYEELCRLREPFDPRTFIPVDEDEHSERLIMGCIESVALAFHFNADQKVRNRRQLPPQLALNLNLNLQFPPNIQPAQLPTEAQHAIQQLMQEVQQQAQRIIQEEVRSQMPITGLDGWTEDGGWRRVEEWPITS